MQTDRQLRKEAQSIRPDGLDCVLINFTVSVRFMTKPFCPQKDQTKSSQFFLEGKTDHQWGEEVVALQDMRKLSGTPYKKRGVCSKKETAFIEGRV